MIELADTDRDEGLPKRITARIYSYITSLMLPPSLRNRAREANMRIEELEEAKASTREYLDEVSSRGSSIFSTLGTTPEQVENLRKLGSRLAGATVIEDMLRDLKSDRETGDYNPINDENESLGYRAEYVGGFRELVDPVLRDGLPEASTQGSLRTKFIGIASALTGGCDGEELDPELMCYRACGCI